MKGEILKSLSTKQPYRQHHDHLSDLHKRRDLWIALTWRSGTRQWCWPPLHLFDTVPRVLISTEGVRKTHTGHNGWKGWDKILSSFQFSHSVVSDSLQPPELQHHRPPCPRVHPNPCLLSRWCHPTISSSVISFSFCPQSFPASGSFEMSQLFPPGGQSIGVSASASVLPMNTQDWSPLGWTGWISLQSKGLSRVFSKKNIK